MKFLFISNYYPPHHVGGYELHCQRLADWIVAEGHKVRILTSTHKRDGEPEASHEPGNPEVLRELTLRYWTDITDTKYWRREWRDIRLLRRQVLDFGPDVIVLWNMVKLASGMVMEAERLSQAVVYHLMDEWASNFRTANGLPQFWSRPATSPWGKITKPLLGAFYRALFTPDVSKWNPRNATFVSEALREMTHNADVQFVNEVVSYITCDTNIFYPPSPYESTSKPEIRESMTRTDDTAPPVRFLWAGRLCEGKGLFTTLDALDTLHSERGGDWTLDFCGPFDTEAVEEEFQRRTASSPWAERVRYLGSVAYDAMPEEYRSHDVFLFTSQVHEGLPGTLVEAFACGLPVIGTLTGGTKDILRANKNCLVFEQGNATELAQRMHRMLDDRPLRHRLSESVAEFAQEHCSNARVFPRLLDFYTKLFTKEI